MSDYIPPQPPPNPDIPGTPLELSYQTPPPTQNARTLVLLPHIFLFVSALLSLLNTLLRVGTLIYTYATKGELFPAGIPVGTTAFFYAMMFLPPIASLICSVVKAIGANQLRTRGKWAWGLGLTAAIISCIEFWSCPCCVLNMGAGIYSIVILCFPHVRAYLGTTNDAFS